MWCTTKVEAVSPSVKTWSTSTIPLSMMMHWGRLWPQRVTVNIRWLLSLLFFQSEENSEIWYNLVLAFTGCFHRASWRGLWVEGRLLWSSSLHWCCSGSANINVYTPVDTSQGGICSVQTSTDQFKPVQTRPGKRYDFTTDGSVKLFGISGKMQAKFYAVLVIAICTFFREFLAVSWQFCQFNGVCLVNEAFFWGELPVFSGKCILA